MKYNFDEVIDRRNTNALNTDGFVRLNLAMPRSILETGMERIAASVEKYRKSLGRGGN